MIACLSVTVSLFSGKSQNIHKSDLLLVSYCLPLFNLAGSGLMKNYWMKPLIMFKDLWKRNVISTLTELKQWLSR